VADWTGGAGIVKVREFDQKLGQTRIPHSLIVQHAGYGPEGETQPTLTYVDNTRVRGCREGSGVGGVWFVYQAMGLLFVRPMPQAGFPAFVYLKTPSDIAAQVYWLLSRGLINPVIQ